MSKIAQSELPPYICGHHQILPASGHDFLSVTTAHEYAYICRRCYNAQLIRLKNENQLNKKGPSNKIFTFQ